MRAKLVMDNIKFTSLPSGAFGYKPYTGIELSFLYQFKEISNWLPLDLIIFIGK
jgi:hypothetical protein